MKIILTTLGVITTIAIICFIIYPSLFMKEKSLWGKYDNFEDVTNFNSSTFDLYKKVTNISIRLRDDDPFISLGNDGVTYLFFDVIERTVDNKWPHKYLLDMVYNAQNRLNIYCVAAIKDDSVVGKRCIETPFEPEKLIKLSQVNLGYLHEEGTILVSVSLIHLDNMDEFGWDEAHIKYMKRKYSNDNDYLIIQELSYEES
ncbi:hypothetical protein RI065_08920 [Mycoplasmatota bacterium zrk1]